MVPDYGKVWYYDKSIASILPLANFSINTGSPITHKNIIISLFTPRE